MAEQLIQYPPGQPFPGAIGRTLETSTPAWPARPEPPEGAPNVVFIVLDDVGYGQLGCFGGLCRDPQPRPPRRAGACASATSTPPRCARRRGAACSPGATTTRSAWSAITEMSLGYPATTAPWPFEHGFLSEMLLPPATTRSRSASGTSRRRQETTPAGPVRPLAARPRLRALLRLPRRRHRPVAPRPRPRQPLGAPAGHARRRATTSPRTWPTTPSSSSRTRTPTRPTSRSSCTSPPAPATRRTRSRPSGSSATPARSTRAGTSTAGSSSRASSRSGIVPAGTELSGRDPDVPSLGRR